MDLWAECRDGLAIGPLCGSLLRMVESQQHVATLSLVDDLAEQALLEDLIDGSKPPAPASADRLHYLLATPFRYPPLRHGSRFGRRFEPSLFYGASRIETLLAEAAYYRFVFWSGMTEPPPSGRLLTQHQVFSARWHTQAGVRLQDPSCAARRDTLRHPRDYGPTQALGSALRAAGVGGFEYPSARDPEAGVNIALLLPDALASRSPDMRESWLCETRPDLVRFSCPTRPSLHELPVALFAIDGELPRPAH
jgi:hypothetical protein